ncbi:MAG: leucine-rich repeat domain-containing protein [Clostridia bacterium]|nr:leucine-rich repeat domain-containing protein [Clostridia bacterium]
MNQKLQKWLSILLVTVMLLTCAPLAGFVGLPMNGIDFALPAFAEEVPTSGTWGDNLTWNLDTDGVLTISGSGEMEEVPLFGDGKPGWLSLAESVRSIVIEDGITNIEAVAFIGCTAVTQVTVCADVAEIGMFAFANCTALEKVIFEGESQLKTVYDGAFYQCSSLTDIDFPAGVTYFGASVLEGTAYYADEANWTDGVLYCGSVLMGVKPEIAGTFTVRDGTTMIVGGAFSDCTSLTGVTIPDSITSIGASTFSGCTALTSVTIPDSVTSIGNYAFENCTSLTSVTVPDSVTSIGNSTFSGCTALTSVTIPDSVTDIGNYAFENCTSLTSVTIPDSVTGIGNYAFENCTSLTSVTVPDSVTSIGDRTFSGCTALTSVTIPDSVTSIGARAFYGCSALNTIAFPDSVTSVGADALEGTAYYNDAANWTDGVLYCGSSLLAVNSDFTGEINIREGTRTIASDAFYYCNALNEIAIPDSVVSIGSQAFYCCYYLTNITFGEGSQLTDIGSSAFYNCQVLESIALPDTVTKIGSRAFQNCYSLADINIPANLTQLPSYVFQGTVLTSVTIPASVTGISTNAFYNCRTLESIHVEEGNTVYSSADGVLYDKQQTTLGLYPVAKKDTSFTVPDTVTTVFTYAFDNSYVENLTVPASVTQLNENTFYCTSLTSITVDADNENYATQDGVLYNKDKTALLLYPQGKDAASYEIADTVRVIAVGAFKNNDYLTVVTIPASVTEIAEDAFSDCDNLQVVSFAQDSVLTSIGEDAFYSCDRLWALAVPASVTSIGNWAFSSTNLNPVILARECEIGSSIMSSYKTIYGYAGSDAQAYVENSQGYPSYSFVAWPGEGDIPFDAAVFGTCSDNLTWVLHNDGALSINGTGALNIGEYDVPSWNSLRSRIRSLVIGEGVTALNGHAFMGCTNLTDVTLSSTVTSIDVTAFCDCESLMRFTVDENNASYTAYDGVLYSKDMSKLVCHPQGKKDDSFVFLPTVTTIGENAFYGCAVRTTTVKQTVQGYGTFYMYYLNVPYTVTSVGANAFDSIVTPGGNNYFYYIEFYNPNCEIYDSADTIKSSQYLAIGGYEDSTAQTYATKYNRTFASLGAMPEDHTPAAHLKENEVAATCETEGSYDLVVYCADEGCNKELHRATIKVPALGHVFGDYVQTVAPDCENPGKKVASCRRNGCDATDEKEIPALGHSFTTYEPSAAKPGMEVAYCDNGCGATDEREVAGHEHTPSAAVKENEVAATCEEDGSYDLVVYCDVCGDELERETVTEDALGHSFTKYEQTVAPDCENAGLEIAYCDHGCQTTDEREVTALGHTPREAVKENIVGADCVNAGSYDLVVYCDVCGDELERTAVTGEALGHTPLNAVKENEVAADCEKDGSYDLVVYCDVCGVELSRETVTVNALGHSFTKYEQTVAPDCENAGLEIAYCDHGCQATDEREVTALGHTPLEAVKENIVGADCVTAGSYDLVVYCDVCGAELERTPVTGEALGHTPLEAVKENEVAADCEKDGSYDLVVYCDVCGAELSRETVTVDALGHSFTKYEQTVAPDCANAGLEIAYCDHGCQATDEREVPALGHSFTKYEEVLAPDCENSGLEKAVCDRGCGAENEQSVPALGHSFTNYVSNNDATCEEDGTKTALCDRGCGKRKTVTDKGSKLPHIDEDGDEVCDVCGNSVYISVEECECTCHHTDVFNRFVYKIIQFIRRMFGINSSCDCGTVHTEGLTPFWKLSDILAEKVDE